MTSRSAKARGAPWWVALIGLRRPRTEQPPAREAAWSDGPTVLRMDAVPRREA